MRRGTDTLVARELVAAPTPFEKALKKAIEKKIRELKREGTVSMGLNNLMMVVRPPSSSLEGAPRGTNARYHYNEMFRDVAKNFRSFLSSDRTAAATAKAQYEERAADIKKLISRLQRALKKHEREFAKDEKNWGYAGDLGHVYSELNNIVDFMRG